MVENKYLIFGFDSSWEKLTEIRAEVKNFVKNINKDLSDAAVITASELCENAIKFGTNISTSENMRLGCELENNILRIIVTCGVINEKNLNDLINHINKINTEENSLKLYVQQLMHFIKIKNSKETKLGLYRIAYESQFKISYDLMNNTLKIIAERRI